MKQARELTVETGGQEVQVQKRQEEGQKREGDEESYRRRSNLTNERSLGEHGRCSMASFILTLFV